MEQFQNKPQLEKKFCFMKKTKQLNNKEIIFLQ
jgi:hypothetical protein